MANISSLLNTIKNAIYGRDMRSALHDSIKAVNDDTETRLSRNGGTMTGGITMNSNKITSSATPSTDNDYTNKKYVDAKDKEVASYSNSDYPECTTVKSALDKTFEKFAEKGKPNGYAGLDKDGKIPTEQLPPITMLEYEITDSDGGTLLDSNGQPILGHINVINAITDINETIEKLKQHAILDSTF